MAEPCNLEALRSSRAESGFLNVKVTTSGKFQAQLFIKAENRQRGLGTFDTAEEAAVAVAHAKRAGQNWAGPTAKRLVHLCQLTDSPCVYLKCGRRERGTSGERVARPRLP